MKSVKPGRGSSMMNGIGGIFAALFGVVWTWIAVSMGAPAPFALFGVVFIGMALADVVYNFHNAAGENRFSEYDITEDGEEPDPLEKRREPLPPPKDAAAEAGEGGFCPYCGAETETDYVFCRRCGRKLEG